jgi:hypothetical protein
MKHLKKKSFRLRAILITPGSIRVKKYLCTTMWLIHAGIRDLLGQGLSGQGPEK